MDWPDTFVARLKSKETAGASSEVQLIFSLGKGSYKEEEKTLKKYLSPFFADFLDHSE